MEKVDWFSINDGYGIVGYGFICPYCGHANKWVSTNEDRYECEKCHAVSESDSDPDP